MGPPAVRRTGVSAGPDWSQMNSSLSADPGQKATMHSIASWALAFAGLQVVQLTLLSLWGAGPSPSRLRLHRARIALRDQLGHGDAAVRGR